RYPRGHGLERDDPERLVEAREAGHVGDPEEAVAILVRDEAGEERLVAKPQLGRAAARAGQAATGAGDDQLGVRSRGQDARHRLDQQMDALLLNDAADVEDDLLG